MITGVGSLDRSENGELSYVDGPKNVQRARVSLCSVVIAPRGYEDPSRAVIYYDPPRLGFARALSVLIPARPLARGVHPTAVVAPDAQLGEGVGIGAYVVIREGCRIGARTQIGDLCVVSRDASIGEDALLYPGVTVYHEVQIGNRCIIHSGAVIGSDGLGFVLTDAGFEKFPQVGSVVVEDDVEVGANTTIDRGAVENTVIGKGTKLDNLVHVAHNVIMGESCVVAAQTGIAGSTTVGSRVSMGGQVGLADHCTVEDGAILGAQAGIPTGKRIRAKQMVWGTPARPMEEYRDQYRNILSIGTLRSEIAALKKRLDEIEAGVKKSSGD